jgi:hypothetical protein
MKEGGTMKRYHKTNVGDTGHGTTHPEHDMEFDDTLSREEFVDQYGTEPEDFGEPINRDVGHAEGKVADVRCGEHDGRLVECIISAERDEIEIWMGTAVQDMDGYRWEAEGKGPAAG